MKFICQNKRCARDIESRKACVSRTPKYCSRRCFGLGIAKWKNCPNCNGLFYNWRNKYCSWDCKVLAQVGVKATEEHKKNLSVAHMGKRKGPLNNMWKGGVTAINDVIRTSTKYKQWRYRVFNRDKFLCRIGGKKHGSRLNAHHIKSFAKYPKLRFVLSNGITLCESCHKKTDNYARKSLKA